MIQLDPVVFSRLDEHAPSLRFSAGDQRALPSSLDETIRQRERFGMPSFGWFKVRHPATAEQMLS
jgi:hypothetical protein